MYGQNEGLLKPDSAWSSASQEKRMLTASYRSCERAEPVAFDLFRGENPSPCTPENGNWLPRQLPQTDAETEQFVERLKPLLLKLVRSRRPRREPEEDLLQTIFAKIFSKFHQYSGDVPLVHWVSRIAINTCLNHIAQEKIRPEWAHADLTDSEVERLNWSIADEQSVDPSEQADRKDYVEAILARLKPEDRMLLTLLHLQGYSVEDVSGLTGWSAASVKVRAFRARAKLRRN
jgi:RNA polymerase sigma-70 factor (ECF subfamily)